MAERIEDRGNAVFCNRAIWLRGLFMLLFVAIYHLAAGVIAAVAVVQFVVALFNGSPNPRLSEFGEQLARYFYQIARFLTFRSDDKPWPFMDWPSNTPA